VAEFTTKTHTNTQTNTNELSVKKKDLTALIIL